MGLKQILKIFGDSSEYNRSSSVKPVISYILAVLIDRTNCSDLQGISHLSQKARPNPGQKPKVLAKLVQNCEQIRILYFQLLKRILTLCDQDDVRERLDQIIDIFRALIMDPAPQIQKTACQGLAWFCSTFKSILLHYTQIMGRALLLPLVSKKSKIRCAALQALTAVLWCGLWKFNAFVFQNLIGFRDPNSVPIKDFYEPSSNINYLATFINDANAKVRLQFIQQLYIWCCKLDDKYDHHGRLVPYILSGLFDQSQDVQDVSLRIITQIGRQIQIQKQKQFRQNKQFAIDAAWTWEGKLVDLPVISPLKSRPALGARVFVRGHVRKFWSALYKQIKDINDENKIRAAHLMLFGTLFTQNYMTQYLDVLLPNLLSSIVCQNKQDQKVSVLLCKTLALIGRFCQVSSYVHILSSALKGQIVGNQQFLRAAIKAFTQLARGAFQSIPLDTGLCHKKIQIQSLLSLIQECRICNQIYKGNSSQAEKLSQILLQGLQLKSNKQQRIQIMNKYGLSLMKLVAVTHYQTIINKQTSFDQNTNIDWTIHGFKKLQQLNLQFLQQLKQFTQQAYMNPPTLMDVDWKLIVAANFYFSTKTQIQEELNFFNLTLEVMVCSISTNKTTQMLSFIFKYVVLALNYKSNLQKLPILISAGFQNLAYFHPVKKVPVYDQHLLKPPPDSSYIKTAQQIFIKVFNQGCQGLQKVYKSKQIYKNIYLPSTIYYLLKCFKKDSRDRDMLSATIRTLWLIFQRVKPTEVSILSLNQMVFKNKQQNKQISIPIFKQIIDFLIERLETIISIQGPLIKMIFETLIHVVAFCPKINTAADRLLQFYPQYPELLQKLFKYALDQKDQQLKQMYQKLLYSLCQKVRPWFQLQQKLSSQSNRFARSNLLKQILSSAIK